MTADPQKKPDDTAPAQDLLRSMQRVGDHLLAGMETDSRVQSGVPGGRLSGDLDFIQMTGLTRPGASQEQAVETPPAFGRPDLSDPLSFYEKGVADVDTALGPPLREGLDDTPHLELLGASTSPRPRDTYSIEELKQIINELSQGEPGPEKHAVDSGPAGPSPVDEDPADGAEVGVAASLGEPDEFAGDTEAPHDASGDEGRSDPLQTVLLTKTDSLADLLERELASQASETVEGPAAPHDEPDVGSEPAQTPILEPVHESPETPVLEPAALESELDSDADFTAALDAFAEQHEELEPSAALEPESEMLSEPPAEQGAEFAPELEVSAPQVEEPVDADFVETVVSAPELENFASSAEEIAIEPPVEPDALAPEPEVPISHVETADSEALTDSIALLSELDVSESPVDETDGETSVEGAFSTAESEALKLFDESLAVEDAVEPPVEEVEKGHGPSVLDAALEEESPSETFAPGFVELEPDGTADKDLDEPLPLGAGSSVVAKTEVPTPTVTDLVADIPAAPVQVPEAPRPYSHDLAEVEQLLRTLQEQPREAPAPSAPPISAALAPSTARFADEPDETAIGASVPATFGQEKDESVYRRPQERRRKRKTRIHGRVRRRLVRLSVLMVALLLLIGAAYMTYRWSRRGLSTPDAFLSDAAVQASKGHYSEAAAEYADFVARNPNHPKRPDAQFNAAFYLQVSSTDNRESDSSVTGAARLEQSLKLLQQFIEDNPLHPKVARAKTVVGLLQYRLKRYKEAVDQLHSPALRLEDPYASLVILRTLASSYARLGDFESAKSAYLQAASLADNYSPDRDYQELGDLCKSMAEQASTPEEKARYLEMWSQQLSHAILTPGIDPATKKRLQSLISTRQAPGEIAAESAGAPAAKTVAPAASGSNPTPAPAEVAPPPSKSEPVSAAPTTLNAEPDPRLEAEQLNAGAIKAPPASADTTKDLKP